MVLAGKVVFITGSTRGIGKTLAEEFAKAGCHVVINGRKEIPEDFLATLQATHGVKVLGCLGDIAKMEDCQKIQKEIKAYFGSLDILINNAGITKDNLLLRMSEEEFRQCVDVNLVGTFNMTKTFLKDFMKKRSGVIINMASISGVMGNVGQTNYAASKAGVIGFTKSLAREVAARNITCNAIAPGFIATEMTDVLGEPVKEQMKNQIPLGKFGQTKDIAKGALFLADSPYITGQVLNIDGGLVMNG